VWPTASARTPGKVARRIAAELSDSGNDHHVIVVSPGFRHDNALQRMMIASTSSKLNAVVDTFMPGAGYEAGQTAPDKTADHTVGGVRPTGPSSDLPTRRRLIHEDLLRSQCRCPNPHRTRRPSSFTSRSSQPGVLNVCGQYNQPPRLHCSLATGSRRRPRLRCRGHLTDASSNKASDSAPLQYAGWCGLAANRAYRQVEGRIPASGDDSEF